MNHLHLSPFLLITVKKNMAEYSFVEIEEKWRKRWEAQQVYRVLADYNKPKFYVLDMFPYPSGSGLHVGHPLGYIASDIFSRYKRMCGFNVLHPMGFDAFGLPAEQYAIQTGRHPAATTSENIERYRRQLDLIGFSFDWSREVRTSDPDFYKWTQWIFLKLFNSWYNTRQQRAESIDTLLAHLAQFGTQNLNAHTDMPFSFSADQWNAYSEIEKSDILLHFRLAYRSESVVNWCSALGTVLANDEVKDGVSERGGHPVEQRKMKQWSLRITAYAERLLQGLESIDWSDSIKEFQRNWIGKSSGASLVFKTEGGLDLEVFTTRPDTLYGVTFLVLAPEHELALSLATAPQRAAVEQYIEAVSHRLERDRVSDVKHISGVFTGSFALHPITGQKLPIWLADYVLAGYGTGAIMAVPGGDLRDWMFARHFDLPIVAVIEGTQIEEGPNDKDHGKLINSDFLDGLAVPEAKERMIAYLQTHNLGAPRINYKLRDAVFGRQRYWGEPIPIYYRDNVPMAFSETHLPLILPNIDKFLPTADGDPPLGRAETWNYDPEMGLVSNGAGFPVELTTMPGWAGSSWYYLRYTDPGNRDKFNAALDYWQNVDLYIGGAEHATGHLLYFRFFTKFLHDLGLIPFDEPAKKLINQGMIQAEDGQKMSKRHGNVVNPDDMVAKYGADTFRMYEMFLGPVEQHKPWNTHGIEGVSRFLRKFWRLFYSEQDWIVADAPATDAELKILHKTIKKVTEDVERLSLNTSVSAFMVCVNELSELKCHKRCILDPLVRLLSPFAPFVSEELWEQLGGKGSVTLATYPLWDERYMVEDHIEYPVSFNGKRRFGLNMPADASVDAVRAAVLDHDLSQKWLEGKTPKKVIVVPGKIVNVVV
jgi:leucyl-tRNA synthetase